MDNNEDILWPKRIKLSCKQASILRNALPLPTLTHRPSAIFYCYRIGLTGPSLIYLYNPLPRDQGPSAPHNADHVENRHLDTIGSRLYPVV